jgi:hypothetical protein
LNTDEINPKTTISLPYVKGLTEKISKTMRKQSVRVIHRPMNINIGGIKPFKDKLDKLKNSDVVYQIPCAFCDVVYIGETSRLLKTRITEHKNNINGKEINYTALTKHRLETGHNFNYSKVKILAKEKNKFKRRDIENYFIKKCKNSVNERFEKSFFPEVYNVLL